MSAVGPGFVLLLAAVLAWPAAAVAQQPPCQLQEVESLDLDTGPDGSVTVPVTIENHTAHLMLDTGAAFSILDESFARSVGLTPVALPFGVRMVLGGNISLRDKVKADQFQIGHLRANGFTFVGAPSSVLTHESMGMLGTEILAAYEIEIDFAGGKLNLFTQDHCPGQVVYWTKEAVAEVPITLDSDRHIRVPVTLDGKQLTAVADTGAGESFMSFEVAKDLFGIDETNPALKKVSDTYLNNVSHAVVYRYPFQSLTFEGIAINNPDIAITKEDNPDKDEPQLLIGIGVLRQLHLFVSYKEKVLYLTAAEAH